MKSRFRAYLAIISIGSLLLFGAGLHLQVQGVRALVIRSYDSGFAELFFGLLVAATGVSLFVFGWKYTRREQALAIRKEQFPDEKWKWRADWADGLFVDRAQHPRPIIATAAIVTVLAVVAGYRSFLRGGVELLRNELVLLIVVGLCICLIGIAIVVTRRWSMFGEFRIDVKSTPIPVGGKLSGILVTDIAPEVLGTAAAEATLICSRVSRQNLRHSRSIRETVIWRSAKAITPKLGIRSRDEGKLIFPILFGIPEDAPESTPDYSDERIEWKLVVTSQVGRSRNKACFVLPVFETESDNADEVVGDKDLADHESETRDVRDEPSIQGIAVRRNNGTTSITVEATKRFSFAAATIGFGILWCAVVGYLAVEEAPRLLTILAGAFVCVPIYGALCIWFERTQLLVNDRGLVIHRQLGPIRYKRTIPANDIGELLLSSFASVGSTNYFDLILVTRRGRRLLVVGRLAGQSSIEWIGFQINAAIGRCSRVAFSGTVIANPAGSRALVPAQDRAPKMGQAVRSVAETTDFGRVGS